MRKQLLLSLCAMLISFGYVTAQKYDSEFEYMQSEFGKDKKTLVKDFMKLSKEEDAKFWPVYDAYDLIGDDSGLDRAIRLADQLNGCRSTE